ncbi:Zonadhesin [Arthrobotrys entomopaga]|nr:Zonadhesin [Arthrobotrys entomopaga]
MVTLVGTSQATTIFPNPTDISGTISIITYVAQPVTTITTLGPSAGTTTEYPTDSAGATLIDTTDTITVVIYTTLVPSQVTTTIVTTGPAAGTQTELPVDGAGSTITDGYSGTVTVRITEPVVTVTSFASTTGLTTLFPTDSTGSTLTNGEGTISVITYVIPIQTTTTVTRTDVSAHTTIVYPTDSFGLPATIGDFTATEIIYVTQPYVTITETTSATGLTTSYPTDPAGNTITDGSGTITVITFVLPPQTTTTLTQLATDTTAYTTTVFPVDGDGSTITDSGTATVINYYVRVFQTVTLAASSTYITTVYPFTTVLPTETVTVLTYIHPTASHGPLVPCSPEGYVIGNADFYSVDYLTGNLTMIASNINGGVLLNSVGYNVLDDYIYGTEATGNIVRVAFDGTTSVVNIGTKFPSHNLGDVDTDGQYWISSAGKNWSHIDLNPQSPTFGTLRATGFTTSISSLGYGPGDWTYVPGAGQYMWAIVAPSGLTSTGGTPPPGTAIARFSMTSHTWQIVKRWSNINIGSAGFLFADSNGDIYFSGNNSYYRTNAITLETPVVVSTAVIGFSRGDSARCVYGNVVSEASGGPIKACSNEGLEVGIFDHPWNNNTQPGYDYTSFDPTLFKTEAPYNQTLTRSVGFSSSPATNYQQPYGMIPHTTNPNYTYALMYIGYFQAPISATYNLTIYNGADYAAVWVNDTATGNWTRENALTTSIGSSATASHRKGTGQIALQAGDLLPIRIVYGNANGTGAFSFEIHDRTAQTNSYVQSGMESPYFVRYACDGHVGDFPDPFVDG